MVGGGWGVGGGGGIVGVQRAATSPKVPMPVDIIIAPTAGATIHRATTTLF